jgi:predicted  nucleic acid-binding Zn-ribbon protein
MASSRSTAGLSSEIESFRKMISRLVEQLDEISDSSKKIPQVFVDDLSRKLAELEADIQSADKQLDKAKTKLAEIKGEWG